MFKLRVVLPTGMYLEEDVDAVTVPTIDGQRTLLSNHMATVLPIELGIMYTKKKGEKTHYYISDGAFTFDNNIATLLLSTIENEAEIDFARAERARERAQERITQYEETIDMVRAEAALKRALTRLSLKD